MTFRSLLTRFSPMLVLALVCAPGNADAAGFSLYAHSMLDEDQRPVMKVSTSLPYSSLIFLKRDGYYEAGYALYIRVLDKKHNLIDSAVLHETVTVETYQETKSHKQVSRTFRKFRLTPSNYIVSCTIRVKDTHIAFQKETGVVVENLLEHGIGIGKPQLFATAVHSNGQDPPLVRVSFGRRKGDVEKETSRYIGIQEQPVVRIEIYFEEVNRDSVPCEMLYEVVSDQNETQVLYGRKQVKLSGKKDQFVIAFDVDDWDPETYTLHVRATVDRLRVASSDVQFSIGFTRSMLTRGFEQTIGVLALIAPEEEIAPLRSASVEERPEAWAAFWLARDPSPGTEENEALEEHLQRVQYAEVSFSENEEGWASDRGRVYIIHGEPDQIDYKNDPNLRGQYLIWRYYRKNLEFTFYDELGLGEWRMASFRAM